MCRSEGLTPKATEMVGELLGDLLAALARSHNCDPDQIKVGPVDFGPGPPDDWCPECSEADEPGTCEPGTCPGRPFPENPEAIARLAAPDPGLPAGRTATAGTERATVLPIVGDGVIHGAFSESVGDYTYLLRGEADDE